MTSRLAVPAVHGVLPVFQTPFHEDGEIDLGVLAKEIRWILEQGADGVVMGMVSEILRLDDVEVTAVQGLACTIALEHRAQSVMSVGAESTHVAVQRARRAADAGATALMAIPPLATAVDDDEKFAYYSAIFDAVDVPVVVQDASGYVGQPLSIAMQARIAHEFPDRAVFKPEAPPIGPRVSELLAATSSRARILEGTGGVALVDSYRRGIVGTMPGADICWAIVALWQALQLDDAGAVERISLPLVDLVSLQTELDSFLAVEKRLLKRQGVFTNTAVRGPVGFHLTDAAARQVDELFEALQDAVALGESR